MSLLVTTSLIDAYKWAVTAPTTACKYNPKLTWREDAFEKFKGMLRRDKFEPSPASEKGLAMEAYIQELVENTAPRQPDPFTRFAARYSGAKFQVPYTRMVAVQGVEFQLNARIDLETEDAVVDIKSTNKPLKSFSGDISSSFMRGKSQHYTYRWLTNKPFSYAVFEFPSVEGRKVDRVHDFAFNASIAECQRLFFKDVTDLMSFIVVNGLCKDYILLFSRFTDENSMAVWSEKLEVFKTPVVAGGFS